MFADLKWAKIFIPLYEENALAALIILGPKISEYKYTQADLALFKIIQHEIILVFKRLKPYLQANQELISVYEENKNLEQNLLEYNQNLEDVGFWVTHDLKNALTGLQLYLENVIEGISKDDGELIQRTLEDLKKQITVFLQNYEQDKHTELNALMLEIVSGLTIIAQPKSLSIKTHLPDKCWVMANKQSMILLFRNLLENAIKYSPDGAEIKIAAEDKGNKWQISISNSGVKVSKEQLEKLFEKGYSGQSSTGLGLYICKAIVEQLHGLIWAENIDSDGVRFVIEVARG